MNRLKHSLRGELILVLIISALISVGLCYALNTVSGIILDSFFETSDYIQKQNEKCLNNFEKYVAEKGFSAEDSDSIDSFIDSIRTSYAVIAVYRNGELLYSPIYDSYAADEEVFSEIYEGDAKRTIEFSDGDATVHLYGFFDYQFYTYSTIIEIIISVIIFLLIFTAFIQKKINYILQLERDIKILETGGLEHEIVVSGKDELSSLADGLNRMRISLSDNIRKEEAAVKANYKLVVSVAHDLRTPLTALLLYLDLLKKGGFTEEEQKSYLEKSHLKANQIKKMTDSLFERFLISRDNNIKTDPPEKIQFVFEDSLSDITSFLSGQQFNINCSIDWPEGKISVINDYIGRIVDNIGSNIMKYADRTEPISLIVKKQGENLLISFSNKIIPYADKTESYSVGVDNIKIMMKRMGGDCIVEQSENTYTITLLFKL